MLTEDQIRETKKSIAIRFRRYAGYWRRRLSRAYLPSHWFRLDPRVRIHWTLTLEPKYLPKSDIWIATFWYTARWAARCTGTKGYLIQHLETWAGPEDQVLDTWRLPLRKIVIARWLEQIAEKLGETADYIPNGLDFKAFGTDNPIEDRHPNSVLMLYHDADWKGSADGIETLQQSKLVYPDLRASLFGTSARPATLPKWISYFQNPPQSRLRELYNNSSIFLAPSWTEGWGLPATEAMMCSCALVATDIGGHLEFAKNEENALLSPPKSPEMLARNLCRVLADEQLRIRLALAGNRDIQRFTWEIAGRRLEDVLTREHSSTVAQFKQQNP